ncbi:MAG: HAD family hydrolase [Polyangiaceae bacterium]|nr:HAD family hydrolase [Polyangiaceae bacterium]
MRPFELVIFDCDGVLVDSERITNLVFAELLAELGLHFTLDDMFEHFVGLSMPQCLEKIHGYLGRPPPDDFVSRYVVRRDEALKARLTPIPGIEAALDALSLPFCVASSGAHEKMRLTLGLTGLWRRFEGRIFSTADVAKPKPAPDVFLYAARTLGAPPAACVVIEDSPTGVSAAVAAGMTVLGYSALMPAARLKAAGAHHCFDAMLALPGLIELGARP